MKCYYQYLNDNRSSIAQVVISEDPLIIVDIDEDGDFECVDCEHVIYGKDLDQE